jgi:hypothetical protein
MGIEEIRIEMLATLKKKKITALIDIPMRPAQYNGDQADNCSLCSRRITKERGDMVWMVPCGGIGIGVCFYCVHSLLAANKTGGD